MPWCHAVTRTFTIINAFLAGDFVGPRPPGEVVPSNHEVSVPLAAPTKGACYVDGYPLEQSPDVVLMHKPQTPGSRAATGCAGVAIPA